MDFGTAHFPHKKNQTALLLLLNRRDLQDDSYFRLTYQAKQPDFFLLVAL